MPDLISRARDFAAARHGAKGQKRKHTGEDYIVHPEAVAAMVERAGGTADQIAAAWLHDTVEDTETTVEEIRALFGNPVADLVEAVTDVSRPEHGNRRIRKAMDRDHLAKASPEAKMIKLADMIDNSASIIDHNPSFARVYIREKAELLPVLKEGSAALWQRASEIVASYQAKVV